ncbi:hypothetical protein HMPREF0693_3502 [Proteus mirabilis ATCC 29906]|nr:hypothetical protein HMPREF0693_3502 [Proteus mirabilis ATCC 29906]
MNMSLLILLSKIFIAQYELDVTKTYRNKGKFIGKLSVGLSFTWIYKTIAIFKPSH